MFVVRVDSGVRRIYEKLGFVLAAWFGAKIGDGLMLVLNAPLCGFMYTALEEENEYQIADFCYYIASYGENIVSLQGEIKPRYDVIDAAFLYLLNESLKEKQLASYLKFKKVKIFDRGADTILREIRIQCLTEDRLFKLRIIRENPMGAVVNLDTEFLQEFVKIRNEEITYIPLARLIKLANFINYQINLAISLVEGSIVLWTKDYLKRLGVAVETEIDFGQNTNT